METVVIILVGILIIGIITWKIYSYYTERKNKEPETEYVPVPSFDEPLDPPIIVNPPSDDNDNVLPGSGNVDDDVIKTPRNS